MSFHLTKLPKSKVRIRIELSSEEFSPYLNMAAKEISKKMDIPGFRRGYAPLEIIEQRVSEELLDKAAEIAFNKTFLKIVEKNNLKPLGRPLARIEKLSKQGLTGTIEVAVFPEVKLPDYKQIAKKINKRKITVEEKEINDVILSLQKSRAKYIRSSKPVENGDQVEIDCEVRSQGVKLENGEIKGQRFIVDDSWIERGKRSLFIPGFEENIKGMRENEEKTFSLAAPKDFWRKELQGKLLEFRVKVKRVFKVELPELNDEFAQSFGNFKNLEELKKAILKEIKEQKEKEEKERWGNEVLKKISEEAEIEVPDILIEKQRDQMIEEIKKQLEGLNLSFETYLSHLKMTMEEFKNKLLAQSEEKVRILLCLGEIGKKENIKVTENEIKEQMDNILKRYPNLTPDQQENLKNYLKEIIFQKKVVERLGEE